MSAGDTKPRAAKRVALNMKATPELRARIEAASNESGLSIAQEVERRLIESLSAEDRLGGPAIRRVVERIAYALSGIGGEGGEWNSSHDRFHLARGAVEAVLDEYGPPLTAADDPELFAAVTRFRDARIAAEQSEDDLDKLLGLGRYFGDGASMLVTLAQTGTLGDLMRAWDRPYVLPMTDEALAQFVAEHSPEVADKIRHHQQLVRELHIARLEFERLDRPKEARDKSMQKAGYDAMRDLLNKVR